MRGMAEVRLDGERVSSASVPGLAGRVAGRGRALLLTGALALGLLPLTACNSFFQCENKPACPATGGGSGGGGGGSTVDFAFVSSTTSDGNTSTSRIVGYNLSGGDLKTVNSVTLPFVPIAMAVNPKNTLLYVASVPNYTAPGIYVYSIGTDGTLTAANNGAALATDLTGAMAISPDGNFLYTVQALTQTFTQYAVASDGTLGNGSSLTVLSLSCALSQTTPVLPGCSVAVSPKGTYVVASLGTQGDAVFGYSSTTGLTNGGTFTTITPATGSGDFSVAIDGNDKAYLAQTSSLAVYQLANLSSGAATISLASGTVPRRAVVDPSSKFLYTANVGQGKIGGYAIGSTTALSALAGQPYAAPASVAALGVDSSDTYLVAAGYDASAGVQLYSIAASGVLSKVGTAQGTSTATGFPVLVAMSH